MQVIVKNILSTDERDLELIFSLNNKENYTFLNPVSYLEARKNKVLFNQFGGIFADGSILVLFIKLFYGKKVKRRSFDMTSVVPALFDFCEQKEKSIYVIASKENEVKATIEAFREEYPKLNVAGFRNGFFRSHEEKENEFDKVLSINPDFLIVGMGIVAQEKFLTEIKEKGYNGIGFTCGGFISQTAKGKDKIDYYPAWVDKLNIRFIYRMYKEKHTRKRYLQAAFIFPFVFVKDRFF